MRKDPGEARQAIDDIVWEHCDEGKNRNGIDCRLPWRNRGESALGIHSMFGSLESILNLEQKHEVVTTISVKVKSVSRSVANRAEVYWKVERSDRGGNEHPA